MYASSASRLQWRSRDRCRMRRSANPERKSNLSLSPVSLSSSEDLHHNLTIRKKEANDDFTYIILSPHSTPTTHISSTSPPSSSSSPTYCSWSLLFKLFHIPSLVLPSTTLLSALRSSSMTAKCVVQERVLVVVLCVEIVRSLRTKEEFISVHEEKRRQ
jgi:hypothetical protein